jgi:hypothetical protein
MCKGARPPVVLQDSSNKAAAGTHVSNKLRFWAAAAQALNWALKM